MSSQFAFNEIAPEDYQEWLAAQAAQSPDFEPMIQVPQAMIPPGQEEAPKTGFEAFLDAHTGGSTISGFDRVKGKVTTVKIPGTNRSKELPKHEVVPFLRQYYAQLGDAGMKEWEDMANGRDVRSSREGPMTPPRVMGGPGVGVVGASGGQGASGVQGASARPVDDVVGALEPSGGGKSNRPFPGSQRSLEEMGGRTMEIKPSDRARGYGIPRTDPASPPGSLWHDGDQNKWFTTPGAIDPQAALPNPPANPMPNGPNQPPKPTSPPIPGEPGGGSGGNAVMSGAMGGMAGGVVPMSVIRTAQNLMNAPTPTQTYDPGRNVQQTGPDEWKINPAGGTLPPSGAVPPVNRPVSRDWDYKGGNNPIQTVDLSGPMHKPVNPNATAGTNGQTGQGTVNPNARPMRPANVPQPLAPQFQNPGQTHGTRQDTSLTYTASVGPMTPPANGANLRTEITGAELGLPPAMQPPAQVQPGSTGQAPTRQALPYNVQNPNTGQMEGVRPIGSYTTSPLSGVSGPVPGTERTYLPGQGFMSPAAAQAKVNEMIARRNTQTAGEWNAQHGNGGMNQIVTGRNGQILSSAEFVPDAKGQIVDPRKPLQPTGPMSLPDPKTSPGYGNGVDAKEFYAKNPPMINGRPANEAVDAMKRWNAMPERQQEGIQSRIAAGKTPQEAMDSAALNQRRTDAYLANNPDIARRQTQMKQQAAGLLAQHEKIRAMQTNGPMSLTKIRPF